MDIRGLTVHELWIEAASEIVSEYYASVVFDRSAKAPLIMLSTKGGMDIEEVAAEDPDAIARLHVDPLLGYQDFHGRRLAYEAGVDGDVVRPVGAMLAKLYEVFVAEEATLVEVNPLIVTPEREVRALDAKVTLDDNALYRHPENAELRDPSAEDPQERMAKERGLIYVKLDGDIGILGNGAGLVMSTLDVVAEAGGSPANFLDAGGGSKAEAIASAVEVILSDPKVKAVLFNIFGGITRGDEVARGLIEAFAQIKPQVPFVVRLDGTNDEEGRKLLAEADLPGVHTEATMDGAAQRVVELAADGRQRHEHPGRSRDPAVRLRHHRAGGELSFAAQPRLRNAGRRRRDPGQGRSGCGGHPGLRHLPSRGRGDAGQHGHDLRPAPVRRRLDPGGRGRGDRADRDDHRGHPGPRRAAGVQHDQANGRARLVGPNCPGILSPGKANVGIIPASFFKEGNVGVVSRSGTLTYQIGNVIAQRGFGNSTIVGIGGDPVPGTDFIDVLGMFEADPETELIVMCGEIGGDAEERAAEFIAEHVTKPVVGYIAGFTAPPGKTMGHAGAIVSGSRGTAGRRRRRWRPRASRWAGRPRRSPSWPCHSGRRPSGRRLGVVPRVVPNAAGGWPVAE